MLTRLNISFILIINIINEFIFQDVERLNATLPHSSTRLVPFYYFNHLDFMWAIDAVPLLYNDMINIMKKY